MLELRLERLAFFLRIAEISRPQVRKNPPTVTAVPFPSPELCGQKPE